MPEQWIHPFSAPAIAPLAHADTAPPWVPIQMRCRCRTEDGADQFGGADQSEDLGAAPLVGQPTRRWKTGGPPKMNMRVKLHSRNIWHLPKKALKIYI